MNSLNQIDFSLVLKISIYALGWLAGYLVVFAPSGIGIRETVLIWMLGSILDSDQTIVLSSIHRFVFIVVEILQRGVSLGSGFLLKKTDQNIEDNVLIPDDE